MADSDPEQASSNLCIETESSSIWPIHLPSHIPILLVHVPTKNDDETGNSRAATGYRREEVLGQNCRFLQGEHSMIGSTMSVRGKHVNELTPVAFEGQRELVRAR